MANSENELTAVPEDMVDPEDLGDSVDCGGDPATIDPPGDRTAHVAIHRRAQDGTAGAFVADATTVNPAAVIVAGAKRAALGALPPPDRPEVPDPALVVSNGAVVVPVTRLHTSDRTEDVLLEVATDVLPLGPGDPEHGARSIWCLLFPRMRGC